MLPAAVQLDVAGLKVSAVAVANAPDKQLAVAAPAASIALPAVGVT